jgi:hypothetical protein
MGPIFPGFSKKAKKEQNIFRYTVVFPAKNFTYQLVYFIFTYYFGSRIVEKRETIINFICGPNQWQNFFVWSTVTENLSN